MKREEAIAFFKDMNECTYGNLEAVNMAIKALEQDESFAKKAEIVISQLRADRNKSLETIDKIRAEIERWHKEGTNWSDIRLMKIEDIIDKYKTESEE